MLRLLLVLAVGYAGWTGYQAFLGKTHEPPPATPVQLLREPVSASFTCDGRTRCTQMTSCAEATYFLRHCPNTTMDGDHDGIPCEDQWCK